MQNAKFEDMINLLTEILVDYLDQNPPVAYIPW